MHGHPQSVNVYICHTLQGLGSQSQRGPNGSDTRESKPACAGTTDSALAQAHLGRASAAREGATREETRWETLEKTHSRRDC